jgi:anti-anti-sigma factor
VARKDDVVWYLTLERIDADGVAVIAAEGRISQRTAPDLQRLLTAAIASARDGVVLDLSGVDYISSAGLGLLEQLAARLGSDGRRLVLCHLQDPVSAALALAGSVPHLTIESTRDAAVEGMRHADASHQETR